MNAKLYTPVEDTPLPFRIDHSDTIISLGSCFSDEIGQRLADGGFGICRNPFGTLYNPASIANALHRLIDDREITADDLVQHDGLWHSWQHHGSFSRPTAEECLEACNASIHHAHQALKKASLLIVTFGTAWVYELKGVKGSEEGVKGSEEGVKGSEEGVKGSERTIVSNCHKLPPQDFVRRKMTVDEIVALWQPLLDELYTCYPSLNILFTVSPIRHLADGAHGNQLSKSTLLLAIDQLTTQALTQSRNHAIHYFPAYEIVLDELRDYRFYGPDLTHPSPLAADIVYERFQQSTMSPATIQQAHNNEKQHKREKHIPIH